MEEGRGLVHFHRQEGSARSYREYLNASKRREEKGREGKGREGKGREGKREGRGGEGERGNILWDTHGTKSCEEDEIEPVKKGGTDGMSTEN